MKNVLILFLSFVIGGSFLGGQTFTAYVETGQVTSSTGSAITFGSSIDDQPVNVYFGIVPGDTDFDALLDPLVASGNISGLISELSNITWSSMVEAPFAGAEWTSTETSIAAGFKPVLAFMNATVADNTPNLNAGTEFGFVEGTEAINVVGTVNMGFDPNLWGANVYTVIVGTAGSLQLTTLVPEPSHYAAVVGLLGLGFVAWRRRRS